jgi:NADH-quinone oxidoreductase subunit F
MSVIQNKQDEAKKILETQGTRVLVCAGTGCVACGALEIIEDFKLKGVNVSTIQGEKVTVVPTGCHGYCEQGVMIQIPDLDINYVKVQIEDVNEIIESLKTGKPVERLLYVDKETNEKIQKREDINFYKKQKRTSLVNVGKINAEELDDAIAFRGYEALEKVLTDMTPDAVIQEVKNSGLRGRGGGGFPTGNKWFFTRAAQGDKKYVICNADEGDPGAFMDGSLMEGDPHRLLEGMAIAAYAIGSDEAYIYVRAEYPLSVRRLKIAIKQAEEANLLGKNILGTDFSFEIHIKEGAGAFVCGEETALIASIEGERGMPRPKPPFPANKGLFGKPTLINNVETYANVPGILLNGADWFASFGTETAKGTKTFALTGDIANTGLIEVPMGTTLREIVFDIGGGLRGGKKFKAAQIGGPSGGCLTEEHLDLPMDYDNLIRAGAMVGSGGLVILSEDTCIVEIARFFASFTQRESCGKCVPCREGTKQILKILERIVAGKGEMEDLDTLQELAIAVKDGSLCGLGKTAPNPVLSTLKYFKDEYIAHIKDKKCPAGVCTAMKKIVITDKCIGCTKCAKTCPVGAIDGVVKQQHVINQDKCIKCEACLNVCPVKAIVKE